MLGTRSWLATLALLAPTAAAQDGYIEEGDVFVSFDGMPVVPPPGQAPGAAASAQPSARQQKLTQLEYDRRPSSILKAWSTPIGAEEPEGAQVEAQASDAKGEEQAGAIEPLPEEPVVVAAGIGGSTATLFVEAPTEAAPEGEATEVDPEAAAKAAEAAAAAAEEAKRLAAEAKAIEREAKELQRNVSLGEWGLVHDYFAGLTEDEQKAAYQRLLTSLKNGPQQRPQVPPQGQAYLEKNRFSPEDVRGLARVPSIELDKASLELLGAILRQALDAGHRLETFLGLVRPELEQEGYVPSRRQLARILVGAGQPRALEGLLPSDEEALAADDREGLNLLARYYLARYAEEPKTAWLEHAWRVTQSALAVGEVDQEIKSEAIQRAVDLAPKLQDELGLRWLQESFSERPERGMEILAAIGSAASQSLATQPMDEGLRARQLELQTTAANALLEAAPERAGEWSDELALLASNWLREALFSYENDDSTSLGPRMQRDYYGNYFYYDYGWNRRGNMPTPIRTSKILELRPSDAWIERVEPTLRPRLYMVFAQLYLKVTEDAHAFPYIEALAEREPKAAESLVDEFLRVWAKNHNPNDPSKRSNPYIYMYGFEERANGIPLTRSKQERNLAELGDWVKRLRALSVDVDEELVASAFEAAHSAAEIYRLETIEAIFGPLSGLEPKTLAALLGKMRTNLVTIWRDPALQEKSKTNRRQKDIESEVKRGYELARETIDHALHDHPDSWELVLARAALQHDENNYQYELKKDPEFSSRRSEAFQAFRQAADLYAAKVGTLEKDDESVGVYETWFYAALGACDLNKVSHEMQLAAAEIPAIRAAMAALPGEAAKRHQDKFASSLFSRMSSVSPAVKFRYVREGLAITGDNELVREARSVFDYYNDLVTEIQLVTRIDGSDKVGHTTPFGLQVALHHTREIERESGGFSKYLQNQNSQNFGWNYGRPLEDYRDKFEEAAREALSEHYEVISITFEEPSVQSRAVEPYGWRETPYAYLLLKPRGAEVDRVPALRLDLDFLDTTGYAVLPVESAVLPIDARAELGESRPYAELALTQTLDERQAKDGKLLLEVKATARGLPPAFEELLELDPGVFEIRSNDDHGVSVVKFHEDGEAIEAERSWTIELVAREGLPERPKSFAFAVPKVETKSDEHYRFVDADLASVGPTVDLEQSYGKPSRPWLWWIPIGALGIAVAIFLLRKASPPRAGPSPRFRLPEPLTPFTVLGLLRDIHRNDGLVPQRKSELEGQIASLEQHYFAGEGADGPDLRRIAESWLTQAR